MKDCCEHGIPYPPNPDCERCRAVDRTFFRPIGPILMAPLTAPLTLEEIDRLEPGVVKKTIEELIENSSLGTAEAKALRNCAWGNADEEPDPAASREE